MLRHNCIYNMFILYYTVWAADHNTSTILLFHLC